MAQRSAGASRGAHDRAGVLGRFRWAFVLLLPLLVLGAGLAGALLHARSPRPAFAQAPTATPTPSTIVHLQPVTQVVTAGQNFSVTINVQGVTNLAAYEFTLQYDPSVVSFLSVANDTFLGSTGRNVVCPPRILTLTSVRFGCVTIGATPPGPSGSGQLATVTLTTSCDGVSPLDLINVTMGSPLGAGIPTQSQGGSVTVTGGGACPTPTPSPTGGPTSTPTVPPPPTVGGPTSTPAPPTATKTPAPQQCGDASGAAMCVVPVSQTAYSGSTFAVTVSADNVSNLGAFQFDLAFNSALIAPVGVSVLPYLGSTGRTVICQQSAPQPDRIGILCVTLGAAPPGPGGSGLLATVTLQALPGTFGLSSLHLTNIILASISAAEIPVVAIQDGVVGVVQPPTPTTTPSITPTFTRTLTPTPTPCPTEGCPTATPTNTPTDTPTATSTPTNTPTPTPCPTEGCPTATPTNTPTNTSTSTPTPPPTSTATSTPSPTPGPCGGGGGVLIVCSQPVSNTAYLGLETTVNVAISGVPELGAFQFTLVYNPAIVTATDASNATFLSSTGRLVTCIRPTQPAGRIELICNTLGPAPAGASGGGIMAAVKLRGNAPGISPLSLQDVIITDVPGAAYSPVSLQGGQITVSEQPTATQTLTPTVTLTPTHTLSPTPCATGGCPTATMTSTPTITMTPTQTLTPPPSATPTITKTATPVPGPLTLRIAPPSQNIAPGEVTLLNVMVDGAVNLGAFQITIQFNPSLVAYQSIAVGEFLGSTGRSVICLAPTVQVDRVSYLCNTLGSAPAGPSGSGVLAYLLIRGFSTGLSPLHFSSVLLTDIAANLQTPASIQDGAIVVSPPATATPVPTSSVAAGGIAFPAVLGAPGAEMVVANVSLPVGAAPIVVHALPASGAGVYKNPDAASIYLGDQPATIYELVTDVPVGNGLGAYELNIQFDPELVSISILNYSFLGSTGRTVYCLKDTSQPHQLKFSCLTSGTTAGPTGTGTLAKISVQAAPGLQLRAAPENGQDTVLDDVSGLTHLSDIFGNPIAIMDVGDAVLRVRALEGDVNSDCQVNVIDEQVVAGRFGAYDGLLLYSEYYDLMPKVEPDGLIDVHDLEVVYGRDNSTCAQPWEQGGPPQGQSTATPSPSPSATPTNTLPPSPTPSISATPTQTFTPTRTLTPSATSTATNTLAATATPTFTPSPTNTLPPPPTSTLPATATLPPPPDGTPTSTLPPTSTQPAGTPTATQTLELPTPTPTATGTAPASVTPAPTPTQTVTPTPTTPPAPTPTPTGTPTPTATETPTTPPPPTTTPLGATAEPRDLDTPTPAVTPTSTLPLDGTPTSPSGAATETPPPSATTTSTSVPPSSPTTGPTPSSQVADESRPPALGLPLTGTGLVKGVWLSPTIAAGMIGFAVGLILWSGMIWLRKRAD